MTFVITFVRSTCARDANFIRGVEYSSAPSAAGKSARVAIAELMMNVMLKSLDVLDESVSLRGIALLYKLNLLCREPLSEFPGTFRLREIAFSGKICDREG